MEALFLSHSQAFFLLQGQGFEFFFSSWPGVSLLPQDSKDAVFFLPGWGNILNVKKSQGKGKLFISCWEKQHPTRPGTYECFRACFIGKLFLSEHKVWKLCLQFPLRIQDSDVMFYRSVLAIFTTFCGKQRKAARRRRAARGRVSFFLRNFLLWKLPNIYKTRKQ